MKRVFQLLLATILVFGSYRCQKELSSERVTPGRSNQHSSPIRATLQGNIVYPSGAPAPGVTVYAGPNSTITDSRGYFRITDAALDRNSSMVKAVLPGYFDAFRSFRATPGVNQLVLKLTAKELLGSLSSSEGGTVAMPNGAKVSLPAGAVQKLNGDPYTGDFRIYAAYIDPGSSDITIAVPGSFMADNSNNDRGVLASYGMLAVELRSPEGELLKVHASKAAGLTIPIPAERVASSPSTISLWYLDEQTGIWKEEGVAQRNGQCYTGEVKHFSYWNADYYLPSVSFDATFMSSDGRLLTNLPVSVRSADDTGVVYAHGYTDSLGQVSGLVPANKRLVLALVDPCGKQVFSKTIGPFSTNTDLGSIEIPATSPSLVKLTGKLTSCDNQPLANGYAMIYWDNFRSIIAADGQGRFSTDVLSCSGSPQSFEIIALDGPTKQEGPMLTIPVSRPLTDVGTLQACGISTSTFLTYTVDGDEHSFTDLNNDSLVAFTVDEGVSPNTYISGMDNSGSWLSFEFRSGRQPGDYAINRLYLTPYLRLGIVKPFNVSISSWPMQRGEFYEGSFSGNFVDSMAISVKHTIIGSFRIRR